MWAESSWVRIFCSFHTGPNLLGSESSSTLEKKIQLNTLGTCIPVYQGGYRMYVNRKALSQNIMVNSVQNVATLFVFKC